MYFELLSSQQTINSNPKAQRRLAERVLELLEKTLLVQASSNDISMIERVGSEHTLLPVRGYMRSRGYRTSQIISSAVNSFVTILRGGLSFERTKFDYETERILKDVN